MTGKKLWSIIRLIYVKFKNYEQKTKSPFIVYTDFETVSVPEDNKKQIRKSLIKTNLKKLRAVMPIN